MVIVLLPPLLQDVSRIRRKPYDGPVYFVRKHAPSPPPYAPLSVATRSVVVLRSDDAYGNRGQRSGDCFSFGEMSLRGRSVCVWTFGRAFSVGSTRKRIAAASVRVEKPAGAGNAIEKVSY